jgi:hypothetical protein
MDSLCGSGEGCRYVQLAHTESTPLIYKIIFTPFCSAVPARPGRGADDWQQLLRPRAGLSSASSATPSALVADWPPAPRYGARPPRPGHRRRPPRTSPHPDLLSRERSRRPALRGDSPVGAETAKRAVLLLNRHCRFGRAGRPWRSRSPSIRRRPGPLGHGGQRWIRRWRACSTPSTALGRGTPMRTPVKEPGPRATATASSSSLGVSVFFNRSSIMGSGVRLWVRALR